MSEKKKRGKEFDNPYSVAKAVTKGNALTKLSMVVLGLGNIAHHQIIKGLGMLAIEIAFIAFMVLEGAGYIVDLVHLGGQEQQKVWSEAKQIYEYTKGDNSLLMLLFGVATCFLVAAFIIFWCGSVKSAYKMQCLAEAGKKIPTFKEDIKSLFDKDLHRTLLTLPILGILIFTVLPLVFMICMAFTNYSKVDAHTTIFDWVGLANFAKVLNIGDSIGSTFWSVLGWTLIWAVAATFSNYILGMILAIVINRKGTRCKAFWRFCFVLSAAVPQFVYLDTTAKGTIVAAINEVKTSTDGKMTSAQVDSKITAAKAGLATETYVNNKVSSVYKYKGSKDTYASLPTTGNTVGDVWNVVDKNGQNFAWTGSAWDALGETIDLSGYMKNDALQEITAAEVEALFN